jgi:hypothetical protein
MFHFRTRKRHLDYALQAFAPRPISALVAIAEERARYAAMADHRPIEDENLTDLGIAYWMAFREMVMGKSSESIWSVVTCSLNIALILCERGIGEEFKPYVIKALDGAFRAKVRADSTKTWRYDGEAISAIRQALEAHDEQIKLATKQQMREALNEVHRRVTAGNVYYSHDESQEAA